MSASDHASVPALLNYSAASNEPRRPWLLTTLGILSIVAACLGIIFNYLQARSLQELLQKPTMVPVPIGANSLLLPGNPGSLSQQQASFEAALFRRRTLSNMRRAQLDSLLASNGFQIPVVGNDFSSGNLDHYITSVNSQPDPDGNLPMDVYLLQNARLEVGDAHAAITWSDSGMRISTQQGQAVTFPINVARANAFATQIISKTGKNLTQAQMDSLQTAASGVWGSGIMSTAITGATVDPNGALNVITSTGSLSIPASGGGTMLWNPVVMHLSATYWNSLIWTGIDGIYGLVLSVFLLPAGILVLRNSPRGYRLHRIYCWLKIPALAWAIFVTLTTEDFGPQIFCILGLIYPLTVYVVLRRKEVLEYYAILKSAPA